MTSWQGGKGSKQRSVSDKKTFEDNWDKIFAPKPKQPQPIVERSNQTEKGTPNDRK
jgi:hypothetical protein